MGDFQNISVYFKKIFYSTQDMRLSELFCLKLLDYNLSRNSIKHYYDIFCTIGFIFDDEQNYIIEIDEFYQKGLKVIKNIISDFNFTLYGNLELAFSVVCYLREYNCLENRNPRINILEQIFNLKYSEYETAYDFVKKIKKFQPFRSVSEKILLTPNLENVTNKNIYENISSPNFERSKLDIENPNSILFRTLKIEKNNSENKKDSYDSLGYSGNKISQRSTSLMKQYMKNTKITENSSKNTLTFIENFSPSTVEEDKNTINLINSKSDINHIHNNTKKCFNNEKKIPFVKVDNKIIKENYFDDEKNCLIDKINNQLKATTTKKLVSIFPLNSFANTINKQANKKDLRISDNFSIEKNNFFNSSNKNSTIFDLRKGESLKLVPFVINKKINPQDDNLIKISLEKENIQSEYMKTFYSRKNIEKRPLRNIGLPFSTKSFERQNECVKNFEMKLNFNDKNINIIEDENIQVIDSFQKKVNRNSSKKNIYSEKSISNVKISIPSNRFKDISTKK